jgi:DNA-binding IclR family transcriptional regulator
MARNPPPELRELAKQRLQRLQEPSPEELENEVEEARQQGYKLIAVPGLRILIRDYSLKPPEKE